MKMNIKTMAIAAMAVIGMTACSKDNGGNEVETEGTGTVTIALSEDLANVRAVAAPQAANAEVSFNNGYVLFVNGGGIINKVVEIAQGTFAADTDADKTQAQADGTKVWLGDMRAAGQGGIINKVPAAATGVWIVGNLPTAVTAPAVAENISAVKARSITIASQNTGGTTNDVTLFGGKDDGTDAPALLVAHPDAGKAPALYAKVMASAVAARVELGSIAYEHPSTNFVTGFKIDGIFLNNYYPTITLGSTASTPTNNTAADNTIANTMFQTGTTYTAVDLGKIYDFSTTGLGVAMANPAVGYNASATTNVWAYNVLAPKGTGLITPQIVVRLSNITTTADPFYTLPTQYLTVKTFKDKTTGTPVTEFKPGYVYYITKLAFDESHLTNVPNQEDVVAYVEAVMMKWTRQEIDGVL